jgi:hypothetical protein
MREPLLAFIYGFRNWRLARLIEDTPVSRVRSAAQGYVELSGTARQCEGEPIVAPLTKLPCVWWLFTIEHRTGSGRETRWETTNRGTSVAPFRLEDDTGACLVGPTGADVRPGNKSRWFGSLPWPVPPAGGSRFFNLGGDDYRYTEHRINEYDRVSVIGEFRTFGGAAAADVTGQVMTLLAEWKRDQPALLARFDADRDGVLSQAEWERARAAARAQIEQRVAPQLASSENIVVQPADQRPFLIAASDPATLARRARWAAAVLLLAFLAAVTTLAMLLFGQGPG